MSLACPGCEEGLTVQFYRAMTDSWILHCGGCGRLSYTTGELGDRPLVLIEEPR